MEFTREDSAEKIERAFVNVEDDKLLQFLQNGFRLFRFIETGETQLRTIGAGQGTYSFNVPIKEPIVETDFIPFELLVEKASRYDQIGDYAYGKDSIDDPEYLAWRETLPTHEDIIAAASEIATSQINERETINCGNCEGAQYFELDCGCIYGGMHYYDMTDDTYLAENKNKEPDANCAECHGTGKRNNDCPVCNGVGQVLLYPRLRIVNELTREGRSIIINIAQLIVENSALVEQITQQHNTSRSTKPNIRGIVITKFNFDTYIDPVLSEIGVDKNNVMRSYGESVMPFWGIKGVSESVEWRKFAGGILILDGRDTISSAPSAEDILQNAQITIGRSYSQTITEVNSLSESEYVLRPTRELYESLNDLQNSVEKYGFTLGYKLSFIATGEVGPSFYLLDKDGNICAQLSVDYDVKTSVENAWLAFQAFIAQKSS